MFDLILAASHRSEELVEEPLDDHLDFSGEPPVVDGKEVLLEHGLDPFAAEWVVNFVDDIDQSLVLLVKIVLLHERESDHGYDLRVPSEPDV